MRKTVLILLALILSNFSFGQSHTTEYRRHIKKADSLYDAKDYQNSAIEYEKAFDKNKEKSSPRDRYNAACLHALAGDSEQSFAHLFDLAEDPHIKYNNLDHLTTDPDLISLRNKEPWSRLTDIVRANKKEFEKDFNRPLIAKLDTIFEDDQKYRLQIGEIEEKYGRESKEMKAQWNIIREKDSVNLIKVKKILDKHSWPGPKIISPRGNTTLFLVIQHADLETQEKYLPLMRKAVNKGNANPSSLALLEDRVAIRNGKKQLYGSQIGRDKETGEYYVLPLADPDHVDKRRADMGLPPLKDYVSHWGIIWEVKEYKEKLSQQKAKDQVR